MKQNAYNSSFIISDSIKGPPLSLESREVFWLKFYSLSHWVRQAFPCPVQFVKEHGAVAGFDMWFSKDCGRHDFTVIWKRDMKISRLSARHSKSIFYHLPTNFTFCWIFFILPNVAKLETDGIALEKHWTLAKFWCHFSVPPFLQRCHLRQGRYVKRRMIILSFSVGSVNIVYIKKKSEWLVDFIWPLLFPVKMWGNTFSNPRALWYREQNYTFLFSDDS